jgi:hypothetical protein
VSAAHEAVLADVGTRELLARLPDWEGPQQISGHDAPAFAPNLLHLLADTGVAEADDARIRRLLDTMLEHVDDEGRFATCGTLRGMGEPRWGALLCDTHAMADVLVRFGRGEDPRARAPLARQATLRTRPRVAPGRADRTTRPASAVPVAGPTSARSSPSRPCAPSRGWPRPSVRPG